MFHPDLIIALDGTEYLWVYVGEDRGEPCFHFVGPTEPGQIDSADLALAARDRLRAQHAQPANGRLSNILAAHRDRRIVRTLGDNDVAVDNRGQRYIWSGRNDDGRDTWHRTDTHDEDVLRRRRDARVRDREVSHIRSQDSWEEGGRCRFVTVPGTTPTAPAVDPYADVRPRNAEPHRTVNAEVYRTPRDRRCDAPNPQHAQDRGGTLRAGRYPCHREQGHPGHHIHPGGSWPILQWFTDGPAVSMYDASDDAAWIAYEAHAAAQAGQQAPTTQAHPDLYSPRGSRVFLYLAERDGESMYRSFSTVNDSWQEIARITEYVERVRRTGRYGGTGRSYGRITAQWPDARPMTADDLPQDLVDDRGRVWLHVGYHEGPRYALSGAARGLLTTAAREAKRDELVRDAGGNVARKWTAERIDREHTIRTRLPRSLAGVSGTPIAPQAPPDPVAEAKRRADAALAAIPAYQAKVRDKALDGRRTNHFRDDAALNKALGLLGLAIPKRRARVPVTVYVDVDDAEDTTVAARRAREAFEGVELPEGLTRNRVEAVRHNVETTFV